MEEVFTVKGEKALTEDGPKLRDDSHKRCLSTSIGTSHHEMISVVNGEGDLLGEKIPVGRNNWNPGK